MKATSFFSSLLFLFSFFFSPFFHLACHSEECLETILRLFQGQKNIREAGIQAKHLPGTSWDYFRVFCILHFCFRCIPQILMFSGDGTLEKDSLYLTYCLCLLNVVIWAFKAINIDFYLDALSLWLGSGSKSRESLPKIVIVLPPEICTKEAISWC